MTEKTNSKTGRWNKFLAILIGLVCALMLGEVCATLYGYFRFERLSVQALLELEKYNTFIKDLTTKKNTYVDTLFPHPFLAFVHRKGHGLDVNNIGLLGPDFPLEKEEDKFIILVTGGSVAFQFAHARNGGAGYLEQILNERYNFNGKKVVVLNGGDGAWKQPQQTILFILYADVLDAVITLDGFNEHYSFEWDIVHRIELPSSNFHKMNPILTQGYERLLGVWACNRLYKFSRNNWLFSHSHLAWILSRSLRLVIQNAVENQSNESIDETSTESIFAFPVEWDLEKRFQYNLKQYKKYVRMIYVIADDMEIKSAFFLQPVPGIDKRLTKEEKTVVGDTDYKVAYRKITENLLALHNEDIPIYSLLDIYKDVGKTIYADSVHCVGGARNESRGYKIMAERIASILEKEWGLSKKKE